MKKKHTAYVLLLALVAVLLASCVGDELFSESTVVAGKPATISFKVQVPGMPTLTRAMGIGPDAEEASTVKHLWVGVYNAETGALVEKKSYENPNPQKSLELSTRSGKCRIVAVANAESINGTMIDETGNSGKENLLKLLEKANTWKEFLKVSAVLSQPDLIVRYSASQFVMCGYMKGADGGETVTIEEGNNVFLNPITLYRLDAYVRMNFYPGNNVTITPISIQVCNIPGVSYLYEQDGNAGDNKINSNANLWSSNEDNKSYYHNSTTYIGSTLDPIFDETTTNNEVIGYSFDYFQRENKNTGDIALQDGVTDYYHQREIENKDGDKNTGVYKSLGGVDDKRQNASYVVFEAEVSYYYNGNDANCAPVPENTAKDDYGNVKEGYYFRVADVKYTIHLGYIEGKIGPVPTLATANDFNCRRNYNYTYNVYINGVDKVRVEATIKDSEPNPGTEGWVSDVGTKGITLDSHYSVVNVKMTDVERAKLVWRIQTPYGNDIIDLMGGYAGTPTEEGDDSRLKGLNIIDMRDSQDEKIKNIKSALSKNQFYNWIQIRPTVDAELIADYPGHPIIVGYASPDDEPNEKALSWDLEAFTNPTKFIHASTLKELEEKGQNIDEYKTYLDNLDNESVNGEIKKIANTSRPYTFFIDEYVYAKEYSKDDASMTNQDIASSWDNYVNKASRKLWLSLDEVSVSSDQKSSYAKAEYVIEQQAVQTYSPYIGETSQGIGVEHLNESFAGRWPNWNTDLTNMSSISNSDGLANQREYTKANNISWTSLFEEGKHKFRIGTSNFHSTFRVNESFYIPNYETEYTKWEDTQVKYDYMKACLARNRDLDGNGTIDDNEIRWYLPTAEVYARMMLGMRSLEDPLFNVREVQKQGFMSPGFGHEGVHYTASDNKDLYAEDMLTVTAHQNTLSKQIRCVRNLGQNSNEGGEVKTTIYVKREGSNIIDINFASESNYKPITEELAAHEITDQLSFPYKSFEYATADCTQSNTDMEQSIWSNYGFRFDTDGAVWGYNMTYYASKDYDKTSDKKRQETIDTRNRWERMVNNDNICSHYSQESNENDRGKWRMPNISELAILGYVGALENKTYFSCSYDYLKKATGDTETSAGGVDTKADYGDGRFFGVQKTGNDVTIKGTFNSPFYIRCVRDATPQQ